MMILIMYKTKLPILFEKTFNYFLHLIAIKKGLIVSNLDENNLGPLLLTWFNFNPNMEK